jgi:hypothetical protein
LSGPGDRPHFNSRRSQVGQPPYIKNGCTGKFLLPEPGFWGAEGRGPSHLFEQPPALPGPPGPRRNSTQTSPALAYKANGKSPAVEVWPPGPERSSTHFWLHKARDISTQAACCQRVQTANNIPHTKVFNTWCVAKLENAVSRGLGGPGGPRDPSKCPSASPKDAWRGFWGRRGRPDPKILHSSV